jgi:hypothetical protein
MAAAQLVPCLATFRAELNTLAPARDKRSDGWIGDTAHQLEVSDHNPDETGSVPIHDADKINEVHAVDVDKDLRESDLTMETVVQFLLGRCRAGTEKRLRYMIYNGRIWEASNDWRMRIYTGTNPHDQHAHLSASYVTTLEVDTRSWHLEEIPVSLTAADKAWISGEIKTNVRTIVNEIVSFTTGDVVPRWTNDGHHVADDDPNPTIPLRDAAFYIGAGARRIENAVTEILSAVAPDSTDATS